MSADRKAQNSSNQSIRKIAVTAHLLRRELHRLKLKRIDLPRADLRLGKKAYATGTVDEQTELVSRVDEVTGRVTQLQQHEAKAASTFAEKVTAVANNVARAVQLWALQLKRRRLLRQFGANLRQTNANSSLAEETQVARGVADRLSSVETEIGQLRPQTYLWARRPLLLSCLFLLLTAVVVGGIARSHNRFMGTEVKPSGGNSSSLSQADLQSILAQGEKFAQETRERQAEAIRQESERMQQRIAEAERTYKAQAERQRLEQEKKARELAQKEEQTRREEAEREKQQEQIATAERARLEQEQEKAEKLSREKAERERAQTERAAGAERARLEEERRVAQVAEEKRQRVAVVQTSKPRSETSLAVERYLRSRLIGGVTENQIVELSDAIAEKFDAADFEAKQRGYCISGAGDQRQILLCMLDQLATGELSPAGTKAAAKRLMHEINQMIPPRAVFNSLFGYGRSDDKALPAVEAPIRPGYQSAGSLASEHLVPFQQAIYDISGRIPDDNKKSPLGYWNMLGQFDAGYVLSCEYQDAEPGRVSRPFYFWYQKVPDGLGELLKNIPADHPIRQVGPPRDAAPDTLQLAMQSNVESAEILKKQIAADDARKTAPAQSSGQKVTGRDIVLGGLGFLLGTALYHDTERRNLIKQRIAESGGTKIECPICHGSGLGKNFNYPNQNPYPYGSLKAQDFDHNNPMYFQCPKCKGYGVIDK